MQCHLCSKDEHLYRCPKCGRMVCKDCVGNGACHVCSPKVYNAAPAKARPPHNNSILQSNIRTAVIVYSILAGLIAVTFGLVIYGLAREPDGKDAGRLMIMTGIWSWAIGIFLIFVVFIFFELLASISIFTVFHRL
jgi:hypothetical protein